MRTLVIGDIHGGHKALVQVLERANYDTSEDFLIFLGDYIDRWPESYDVIEQLIAFKVMSNSKTIFLRGNHDQWMIDFIKSGNKQLPSHWYNQGGKATAESYKGNTEYILGNIVTDMFVKPTHIEFFKETIFYHVDSENRAFVHAGYESNEGLGDGKEDVMEYLWNRSLASLIAAERNPQIPKRLDVHKEVYIGHTTTQMWNNKVIPISRANRFFNLDTGGGWSGKLTAMDINTKEYWQSDFVRDLYPGITGR